MTISRQFGINANPYNCSLLIHSSLHVTLALYKFFTYLLTYRQTYTHTHIAYSSSYQRDSDITVSCYYSACVGRLTALYVRGCVCVCVALLNNKKAQLTQGLCATAVHVYHHLEFLKFESCTISSAVPENPTLEPNSTSIGKRVAKLWPFLYIQDGRQPPSWILSNRK